MNTPHLSFATDSTTSPSDERAAVDAARATCDAAVLLVQSAAASARHTVAAVQHQLAHRPYIALGVAAGVGFVVAGGLTSPAAAAMTRLGARLALAAAARKLGEVLLAGAAPDTNPTSTGATDTAATAADAHRPGVHRTP